MEDRLSFSFGMKELHQCSCFILALAAFVASFPQVLITAFSDSWVKMVSITLGSNSNVLSLTWVAAYSYDLPFILGTKRLGFVGVLKDRLVDSFDTRAVSFNFSMVDGLSLGSIVGSSKVLMAVSYVVSVPSIVSFGFCGRTEFSGGTSRSILGYSM